MPEDAEVVRTSVARIDEARKDAERRGRPKTKDLLARERVKQGQVLPPQHMTDHKRLKTATVQQTRQSMTTVVNYVASGRLDPEAGRNLIWMLDKVLSALKAEREDMLIRNSVERLDKAVRQLEKAGMGDIVDMSAIKQSLMEQIE